MLSRSVTRLLRPARRPAAAVANASASFSSSAAVSAPRRTPAVGTPRPLLAALRTSPTTTTSSTFLQSPTPASRRCLSDQTRQAIDRAVSSAPVVLFMKGTPELPQCGFSRASIQILGLQGVDPDKFSAFNVLEDAELRAGIKEYSDWPTIPQLYVDKEFVGGCDILIAMHQSGELAKLFEEKKVLIAPEPESSEAPAEKKE